MDSGGKGVNKYIKLLMVSFFIILFSGCETYKDNVERENMRECDIQVFNIQSLDIGNSVSGSFFIGIGSFNGELKYHFYQESEFGGYELKSLNAEHYRYSVIIKETNTTNPHINYYSSYYRCKDNPTTYGRYELIVPIGTIKKTFNGNVN